MSTKIQIARGVMVDPLNLQPEDIDIKDIATSLSRQCRYLGHCDNFYSVAQHSVLVSIAIQLTIASSAKFVDLQTSEGNEFEKLKGTYQLWRATMKGLMHDTNEVYFGDWPRPLKHYSDVGKAFRIEANKCLGVIYDKYDLGKVEDPFIQKMDLRMLETEKTWVITPGEEWLATPDGNEKPFSEMIIEPSLRIFLMPEQAREQFMERYKEVWFALKKIKKEYLEAKEAQEIDKKEREAIQAEDTGKDGDDIAF